MSETVIILGGAMRSGTTILHRIVCTARESHPYLAESWFVRDQLEAYRRALQGFETRYRDYFGTEDELDAFTRDLLRRFFRMTLRRFPGASVLVLKHPGLTGAIPLLSAWLPETRFVVSVRDPRDTIASMIEVALRHEEESYETPMSTYGRDMEKFSRAFQHYYQNVLDPENPARERTLFVRYEELMTDTRRVVARIGEFCGLTFDFDELDRLGERKEGSAHLDPEARRRARGSMGFWSELYAKGISDSRIGRYREVLSAAEVAQVEKHCAPFNAVFPYW